LPSESPLRDSRRLAFDLRAVHSQSDATDRRALNYTVASSHRKQGTRHRVGDGGVVRQEG
jgi:hypothetical protein